MTHGRKPITFRCVVVHEAGLKIVRRFNPGMAEIAFMADDEGDTNLEFVQLDNAKKVEATG